MSRLRKTLTVVIMTIVISLMFVPAGGVILATRYGASYTDLYLYTKRPIKMSNMTLEEFSFYRRMKRDIIEREWYAERKNLEKRRRRDIIRLAEQDAKRERGKITLP